LWFPLFHRIAVRIAQTIAVQAARNKLVTVHLAIPGLAETIVGHEDEILSVERAPDEAMRDLNRGLKLNEPAALGA
jgi:hypothetical protein